MTLTHNRGKVIYVQNYFPASIDKMPKREQILYEHKIWLKLMFNIMYFAKLNVQVLKVDKYDLLLQNHFYGLV